MAKTIAVDLDGTLAYYDGWKGEDHIGEPVPEMAERVKEFRAAGSTIVIFTARVYQGMDMRPEHPRDVNKARRLIEDWCIKHFGEKFLVTAEKSPRITEFWDDRAKQVIPNTGKFVEPCNCGGCAND